MPVETVLPISDVADGQRKQMPDHAMLLSPSNPIEISDKTSLRDCGPLLRTRRQVGGESVTSMPVSLPDADNLRWRSWS